MKLVKIALTLLLCVGTAQFVLAQDRYGDATLQQGNLTVMRGGDPLQFDSAGEQIPVFVGDVLRVGTASRVQLVSVENATVSMGANAVFQVKPFQEREKQGFARMLFGRFRSLVEGLTGDDEVNTKTATAVIGVKGTENLASLTPRGNTLLVGVEDVTTLEGQDGTEQNVGEQLTSLVLNDSSATIAITVPQEVLDAYSGDNLDSPAPNTPGGRRFPGQQGLINAGIVTEEELEDAEDEEGGQEEGEGGDGGIVDTEDLGPSESDLDDIKENLYRADVFLIFQGT